MIMTENQCEVCHGDRTIAYESMLGVIVTAPCPKCNKPKDERDNALVKVQASQARRQPFVDWTVEQHQLQRLHDDLRGISNG